MWNFYDILPVLVNFIVVVAVLYFATHKAAANFLVSRSESLKLQIAEGEKDFSESSTLLSEWIKKTSSIESKSHEMLEEARLTVARFRNTALENAKNEADRLSKEAKLAQETEIKRAKLLLQKELVEKSLLLAEGYLNKNLSDEDRKKLVANYVETLQ